MFVLAAAPWIGGHHALNYFIGGTFAPANSVPDYFKWPGSPFTPENMTGGWAHKSIGHFLFYALDLLVGKQGFLSFNLPMFLAVAGFFGLWRRRPSELPELLFCAALSVGAWLMYSVASVDHSGECCSVRWFVPLLAPGYYVLAVLLREQPAYRRDLLVLSGFGVVLGAACWWFGPWYGKVPLGWGFWVIYTGAFWLGADLNWRGEKLVEMLYPQRKGHNLESLSPATALHAFRSTRRAAIRPRGRGQRGPRCAPLPLRRLPWASAITSNSAGLAFSCSTSTTVTSSSNASRPTPARRRSLTTSRGFAPRGDAKTLLHHPLEALLPRPGDRKDDLGANAAATAPTGCRSRPTANCSTYRRSRRTLWNVIDAASGKLIAEVETKSGAHNTVVSRDGRRMYLGGLKSPILFVADTGTHAIVQKVGPFAGSIRPFTVNGAATRAFICVNDLLGFEIGDLTSGKKLHRVEVAGFATGPVKRHGCPSHGIGLTPDEREIWVVDAFNQQLHVFDNTVEPPRQQESIALREQPGWITFSLDGKFGYPSTGEVIDVAGKKVIAALADESGRPVHSEKMIEIDFNEGVPVAVGDQFGVGRLAGGAKEP